MKHFVYIHTAPSGHQYVGIHSGNNVEERWGKDGIHYKGQAFYRAIEKYTWDGIYHDWWEVPSRRQAEAEEIYLIKALDSRNNGYNCTDGGEGTLGVDRSGEKNGMYGRDRSGEKNPMYGRDRSGVNHPMYGKEPWNKGKKCPQLSGENNGMYGTHPDHHGENNSMFNKHHSEETKQKMRKPKSEEHKANLRKAKKWYRSLIDGHLVPLNVLSRLINSGTTTEDLWELIESNN